MCKIQSQQAEGFGRTVEIISLDLKVSWLAVGNAEFL
jgi:hypothetical protein